MARPFGYVIAQRHLVSRDHEDKRVRVSLGKPRWNGSEWECPFRIRGVGVSELEFGYGVDSMQALTTALEGIRAVLDKRFGALAWENVLPDDSGFQRQIPITFGRRFTRRLERLVDRECRNYVQQRTRRKKLKRRRPKRDVVARKAREGRRQTR